MGERRIDFQTKVAARSETKCNMVSFSEYMMKKDYEHNEESH